jgi:hypothetical protein
MSRLRFAGAAILLIAFSTGSARADAPDCQTAKPLLPGDLQVWPVHERLADDQPGETRSSLMNDFGEFQDNSSGIYLHTGLDIRGVWNDAASEGDLVLVASTGDVWAVPQFTGDFCATNFLCRVYIKSTDRRHIYYYAHLNVRTDADSDVRAKLEEAAMNDPAADLPVDSNKVTAGQKLAGLGSYDGGTHTHLHFGIFDACENYDGLNPLALLPAPDFKGKPYFDATPPTIGPIRFVRQDGVTEVTAGTCDKPLKGVVDLMVEAKDIYHDLTAGTPPFAGSNSNGIYKAIYRIRRTPGGLPAYNGTWYQFDRAPLRCRGKLRGISCADPDPANALLLDQDDFIKNLAHLPPFGDGGADLGVTYADTLFANVSAPFDSNSDYEHTEQYFHILTNEWGRPDAPGSWDTAAMPDGRYQVSAEVADLAGNKAASHAFVILDNQPGGPDPTGDLVLRDNTSDVGAVPSSLGNIPFWISPDIKVTAPGEPDPIDPAAPIWKTSQDVTVAIGTTYKVWLRVANRGCQTIHDVHAKVAWADPAMLQTSWQSIDVEKGGIDLAPNEAQVLGPFTWTPAGQEGHHCLLAISRATEDQPSTADFSTFVDGWGGTVANDSDITQLNLQIEKTSGFKMNAPAHSEKRATLRFECNDFPLDEERSTAELVTDYDAVLEASWQGLPWTTLRQEGRSLVVRFEACRVVLPLDALAGGRTLNAAMRLTLGPGAAATYRVDLAEDLGSVTAGGMSFTVRQP